METNMEKLDDEEKLAEAGKDDDNVYTVIQDKDGNIRVVKTKVRKRTEEEEAALREKNAPSQTNVPSQVAASEKEETPSQKSHEAPALSEANAKNVESLDRNTSDVFVPSHTPATPVTPSKEEVKTQTPIDNSPKNDDVEKPEVKAEEPKIVESPKAEKQEEVIAKPVVVEPAPEVKSKDEDKEIAKPEVKADEPKIIETPKAEKQEEVVAKPVVAPAQEVKVKAEEIAKPEVKVDEPKIAETPKAEKQEEVVAKPVVAPAPEVKAKEDPKVVEVQKADKKHEVIEEDDDDEEIEITDEDLAMQDGGSSDATVAAVEIQEETEKKPRWFRRAIEEEEADSLNELEQARTTYLSMKKQHRKSKLSFTLMSTLLVSALALGSVGPIAYFMFFMDKVGDPIPEIKLDPEQSIVKAVKNIKIETHAANQGTPVSIYEYDRMVIETRDWKQFTPADTEELQSILNLKALEVPEPELGDEEAPIELFYKIEAAQTTGTRALTRKKYYFRVKAKQNAIEFEKENQFELFSSDMYEASIGTGELSKVNLRNWVDNFNNALTSTGTLSILSLSEKIQTDFVEIDDNAQIDTITSLGFSNVTTAMSAFPYGENGARVKLSYKFEMADDVNVEGYEANFRLTLKAKYPTYDGEFVEVTNEFLSNNSKNNRRAITRSSDRIPHTPSNQAKLNSTVDRMVATLTSPTDKTIKELESKTIFDWVTITDSRELIAIGFRSNTLDEAFQNKNSDIEISYMFQRKEFIVGSKAKYELRLRGRVASGQLVYINTNKLVSSADNVQVLPTNQGDLEIFINRINSQLTPATDKTIADLDANISSSYQEMFYETTLDTLGFTGADFAEKPKDVTLWYKFEKVSAIPGLKAQYLLTLRGLTKVDNGMSPFEYFIGNKIIISTDTAPTPPNNQATTQAQLDSYVEKVNESLSNKPDTDMSVNIEFLDPKVKNVWTLALSSSTLNSLGFENGNLFEKPADVILEYKFVKLTNVIGQKAVYRLTLRGRTIGYNGAEKYEYSVSNKEVTSYDVVPEPDTNTSEAGLRTFLATIIGTAPTSMDFITLNAMKTNGPEAFDRLIFETYGFTGIYLPMAPGDVMLTFEFVTVKMTEKNNVEYDFIIHATTLKGLTEKKEFRVYSEDEYYIPTNYQMLQDYAAGYSLNVPTDKSIDSLNHLVMANPALWDSNSAVLVGATGIRETVAKRNDMISQYTLTIKRAEDGKPAIYSLKLHFSTTDPKIRTVIKEFEIYSTDNVDAPTNQEDLDTFLTNINFGTPPTLTIAMLDSVIHENKTLFNDTALKLLGFSDFVIGVPEVDLLLEFTFKRVNPVEGQRITYELIVYGLTQMGLKGERKITVQSTDIYDVETTDRDLERYLGTITGTNPVMKVSELNALLRPEKFTFDIRVFRDVLKFTNVVFPAKEADVNLTYTFTRGEQNSGRPTNYTLTIYGRTTKGIEKTRSIIVVSSNNYTTPVSQEQLNMLVAGIDLTGAAKTIDQLNALLGTGKTFDEAAIAAFGINANISAMPEDVILTYTLVKLGMPIPNSVQYYTLIVLGSANGLINARKEIEIASIDILDDAKASVGVQAYNFFVQFGSEFEESNINRLPRLNESDLSLVVSNGFNNTDPTVTVVYKVIASAGYKATLSVTFSKGTATEVLTLEVEYSLLREAALAKEADDLVDSIKAAFVALNNTDSYLTYDVLRTKAISNKNNYVSDLGIDAIDDIDLLDEVRITVTPDVINFVINVRVEIVYRKSSYVGAQLVTTFTLKGSDTSQIYADAMITKALVALQEKGTVLVSNKAWSQLQNIVSAEKESYMTLLGIENTEELADIKDVDFTIINHPTKPYVKRVTIQLDYIDTTITVPNRTFTFDVHASDEARLNAREGVRLAKLALESYRDAISTRYWSGLKDAGNATQANYAAMYGLTYNSDIEKVNSVSFTAVNSSVPGEYKKIITAKMVSLDSGHTEAELTVVFTISSFDMESQKADDIILAALQALSTTSFISTLEWSSIQSLNNINIYNYASLMGIAPMPALVQVQNVAFKVSISPYSHQKTITIILTQPHTTYDETTRTVEKQLVAKDKQALDEANINTRILAAVDDLRTLGGVSSKNWAQLAGVSSATKNNYTTVYGLPSKASFYSVNEITFTSINGVSEFTKEITARVNIPGTTVPITNRTVVFTISSKDKNSLIANSKVDSVTSFINSIGTVNNGVRTLTSTLNWNVLVDKTSADKTNYSRELGMPSDPSIALLDQMRFVVTNRIGSTNKYTKQVIAYIETAHTTYSPDKLKFEFVLNARNKAVLDAADAQNGINNTISAANEALSSQTNKTSTMNWATLGQVVDTTLTKDNFASLLGIQIDAAHQEDISKVDTVNFKLSRVSNSEYFWVVSYTITHLSSTPVQGTFNIFAKDRNVLLANDKVNVAKAALNALITNGKIVSTLTWENLELVTEANKVNYYSVLGITRNTDIELVTEVKVIVSDHASDKFTKSVIVQLAEAGTTVLPADRLITFDLIAADKEELLIAEDNEKIDLVKIAFQDINGSFSTHKWDVLSKVTAVTLDDYDTVLGLTRNDDTELADSVDFEVKVGQYELRVTITVHAALSDYEESERKLVFVIYSGDRETNLANGKIETLLKKIENLSTVSTLKWYSGLALASSANKTNYSTIFGLPYLEGMNEITSATFTAKIVDTIEYVLEVTVVLNETNTDLTEEERTYTWILEAADKDAMENEVESAASDHKVKLVFAEILKITNAKSTLDWVDLQNATLASIDMSNVEEELGVTLSQALKDVIANVDSVAFTAEISTEAKFTVKIKVAVTKAGMSFNNSNNYVFVNIVAADKDDLLAADIKLNAIAYLQALTSTSTILQYDALKANTSADKTNYTSRLGLTSSLAIDSLYSINFTWSEKANTKYVFEVEVTFVALKVGTTELGTYTYDFELEATNKDELTIETANKEAYDAKKVIVAFNGTTSSLNWSQIETVTTATRETFAATLGLTYSTDLDAVDLITFTVSNGTSKYSKNVRAVIEYSKATLSTAALTVDFVIYAKDRNTLIADDNVADAKSTLDAEFSKPSITSTLSWRAFSNLVETNKYYFITDLGLQNIDQSKVMNLTALEIKLSNDFTTSYAKVVKVKIVMTGTTVAESELKYEFQLVSRDKVSMDANKEANKVIGAIKGLSTASDYNWENHRDGSRYLDLDLGTQASKDNYDVMFGLPTIQVIKDAEFIKFEVVATPEKIADAHKEKIKECPTYTIVIFATVTVRGVSEDFDNTYYFNVWSKDKDAFDADNNIRAATNFVLQMGSRGGWRSSKNWSEIKTVTFGDINNYKELLGISTSYATGTPTPPQNPLPTWPNLPDGTDWPTAPNYPTTRSQSSTARSSRAEVNPFDEMDEIWIYADAYDYYDGEDGSQGSEYMLKVSFVFVDYDASLSEPERTVTVNVIAADKLALDANDRVQYIKNELDALGTDSTRKWLDFNAPTNADQSNYHTRYGLPESDLIKNNQITFRSAVNHTNRTYSMAITATITMFNATADLQHTIIIDAADKEYEDIADFVREEQKRISELGTVQTNWALHETRIASRFAVPNPATHTGFASVEAYGDMTGNTKTRWAKKSATSHNSEAGTVTMTATISSAHPKADKYANHNPALPVLTQDFTLGGFYTIAQMYDDGIASLASVSSSTNWYASTETRDTIVDATSTTLTSVANSAGDDFIDEIEDNVDINGMTYRIRLRERENAINRGNIKLTVEFGHPETINRKDGHLFLRSSDFDDITPAALTKAASEKFATFGRWEFWTTLSLYDIDKNSTDGNRTYKPMAPYSAILTPRDGTNILDMPAFLAVYEIDPRIRVEYSQVDLGNPGYMFVSIKLAHDDDSNVAEYPHKIAQRSLWIRYTP